MNEQPEFLILGAMPARAAPATHLAGGPWCFCGQEKAFPDWEKRFTFAKEPLRDPDLAAAAARAAQTLALKMMPVAARMLCKDPEKLPDVYWEILLAPWIIDVASQVVERALRVQAMREQWGHLALTVPLPAQGDFDFVDEHDFTLRGSLGLQFNHWLFGQLLQADWPENWKKQEIAPQKLPPPHEDAFGAKCRHMAKRLAMKLPFPKMKGMTLGQAVKFSRALAHSRGKADHSLNLKTAFNFENDLALIPLPPNVAEIFRAALPRSLRQLSHKPGTGTTRKLQLRVASIMAHEDASYRQELAYWRAAGNRLAFCQHGGNYGHVKNPCAAQLVEYSQDIFFTWGWKTQGGAKGNFVRMPSLQLSREGNAWRGRKDGPVIFVGTEMAAYGHRLDSHPTPLQFVAYRQAKADFFARLTPKMRGQCLYRPYFPLPGTLADAEWLLPMFPELGLCKGDLLEQLLICRLLVLDHHGTTLLEAMAADIPTIIYWDREAWPITVECEILLNMLEGAGIFHDSAEKAAAKAMEIWDYPLAWWSSPQARMSRKMICQHQAFFKKDAESIWLDALKEL